MKKGHSSSQDREEDRGEHKAEVTVEFNFNETPVKRFLVFLRTSREISLRPECSLYLEKKSFAILVFQSILCVQHDVTHIGETVVC